MIRRFVLTTLEEDLRDLGLLEQQGEDPEEPAPDANPEGGYAGSDEAPPKKKVEGIPPEIKNSKDDEEPVGKTVDKADLDEDDDEDEDDEKKQADAEKVQETIARLSRSYLKRHGLVESKPAAAPSPSAPKGPSRPTTDRVFALLKEVHDVVANLHREKNRERIEGFQNIAVIADTLSGRFRKLGMALSEGSLFRVGGVMGRLAEDAAQTAAALETPPEDDDVTKDEAVDDAEVDDLFKKFMSKLLDALQLYNDTTKSEADEGDDEGEEDDAGEMDEFDPEPEPPGASESDDEDEDDEPKVEGDDEEEPPKDPEAEEKPSLKDDEDEDDDDKKSADDMSMSESRRILEAAKRRLAKKPVKKTAKRGSKKSEGKGRKLLNQGRKMRK